MSLEFKNTATKLLLILTIFLSLSSYLLILIPNYTPVLAADPPCNVGPTGDQCPAAGIIQVGELLTRIINISTTLAFMAMTVWLAWTAIKLFITSGGDPKALASAWSSVTWIFMGLVFLILAYFTIKLIASFTGAPVDQYCLGFPPYCM